MFKILTPHRFTLAQGLTLGFIGIILIGTGLLLLPFAAGTQTTFMQALFTATSATCVTGLTVVNTAAHWSLFGQIVILALIEVGGLGFMTFVVLLFMSTRHHVNLSAQLMAQQALSLESLSQIGLIRWIVSMSVGVQLVGAALLAIDFVPRYGWLTGIWYSFFHAISAFCNAGFDLFGNSLEGFASDPYVLIVIMLLILAGSFGFLVLEDLLLYRERHHLTLHTKLALSTSGFLLVFSFVVYLLTEQNVHQMSGLTPFQRIVNTLFLAVTPRTAGFDTMPYGHLSMAGIAFTMLLMFIGGTPGSTAGGIKTTTLGVLVLQGFATLSGRQDATFAHRRFTRENVARAMTLFFVALALVVTAVIVMAATETIPKNEGLEYIMFEVLTAFGTTGATLGLTSHLTLLGQGIIMVMMFIGRVGLYTVMYAILNSNHPNDGYRYPEESVLIG
ncbi:TrkH family potassium uptake protein [Levilactobacillus bambusae]|uniref:Trk family potassium uptake protein n=1 Tax=Levilactobacillus bambusae TaxID=2024736 RepID=A0A2V1MZ08_9LACO|nr:potassium transporter TrkG [Levilactobacillus bambusae]PWG00197.1 Trk family potassium uptake protein [Levilactobacillus bambusae]